MRKFLLVLACLSAAFPLSHHLPDADRQTDFPLWRTVRLRASISCANPWSSPDRRREDGSEMLFTTSAAATHWDEQTQPSHTPNFTSLHGWHHLTLWYFPGVCPRMMRLSLLCMCQMNHKPIPYAIAICWWAQAVLVDIKSRDYGGLILSEWRERRTETYKESEYGWKGGTYFLIFIKPTTTKKKSLITLSGISSTWWNWKQTNNFMCTQTTTCLSPCPLCHMVVIEVAVKTKGKSLL